jgi:ribosome-binding factor A
MSNEFHRSKRVGDQIQRELSELLRREINDPRLNLVTISGVDVSKDLGHARVFVSSLRQDEDMATILQALQHAAGHMRHMLGKRMKMRVIPQLHFEHDTSFDEGSKIDALLHDLKTSE